MGQPQQRHKVRVALALPGSASSSSGGGGSSSSSSSASASGSIGPTQAAPNSPGGSRSGMGALHREKGRRSIQLNTRWHAWCAGRQCCSSQWGGRPVLPRCRCKQPQLVQRAACAHLLTTDMAPDTRTDTARERRLLSPLVACARSGLPSSTSPSATAGRWWICGGKGQAHGLLAQAVVDGTTAGQATDLAGELQAEALNEHLASRIGTAACAEWYTRSVTFCLPRGAHRRARACGRSDRGRVPPPPCCRHQACRRQRGLRLRLPQAAS